MAYTALVVSELTPGLIQAGENLVRRLDGSNVPVTAAFWLRSSDEENGRRLAIVSPEVSNTGTRRFYGKLNEQLRALADAELNVSRVTALRPDDPTVALLRTAVHTGPGLSRIRYTRNVINGTLIPDALIYRMV